MVSALEYKLGEGNLHERQTSPLHDDTPNGKTKHTSIIIYI